MFGSIKKEIASELAHTVLCTRRLEGWQVNNEPPNENNKLQMNEVPPDVRADAVQFGSILRVLQYLPIII